MKKFGKSFYKLRLKNGNAVTLRHHQRPYTKQDAGITGNSYKAVSAAYLNYVRTAFGFKKSFLSTVNSPLQPALRLEGSGLKLESTKSVLNTRVVTYQQVYLGIPVWRAGVNVRMFKDQQKVVSSSSTVHNTITLPYLALDERDITSTGNKRKLPAIKRKLTESEETIPPVLRRIARTNRARLVRVDKQRTVIYRYERDRRFSDEFAGAGAEQKHAHPTLTLASVPRSIKNGSHRLCTEVFFALHMPRLNEINWRLIVDVDTGTVLYARASYHCLDGLVFPDDPVRQSGDATLTTASPAADLDPYQSSVELLGLTAPAAGDQTLDGEFVTLSDTDVPNIAAPTEAVGTDFDYASTTDDFTAVNAYYHLDTLYRMVEDFGFVVTDYFAGTTFPIPVDHRGENGVQNAHHHGNDATAETTKFRFGLLNTADPVGYATDRAPVIHEFAHSCLQNNIADGVFSWCHGFGDALGVVLSDPESIAPDRFMRSPFMNSGAGLRRHDRDPVAGWAWGGTNDVGGSLFRRQILSTTMFRAYLSTGGDDVHGNAATQLAGRQFAARYMSFLMVGAVGAMSSAAPPASAEDFATAVIDFDVTNADFEGHPGGAFHKVVRWAFEKQGLYKLPGDPADGEGAPTAVDVYIDDGRDGEYEYRQNFWNTTDIWSAQVNDSTVGHQTPLVGVTNYFFAKIKNRGQVLAENVAVKAYHCRPGTGLVWPVDWTPMDTPEILVADLAAGAETIVGPFEWTPTNVGHECLLASVSADGDESNADTVNGDIPHWRLVPFDNNIAQRNVSPEEPDADGLTASLTGRSFWVNNPYDRSVTVELETFLPDFLRKKEWDVVFKNPGGARFTVGPRGEKKVTFSIKRGAKFKKSELSAHGEQIDIHTTIAGRVVGGMTYVIDPRLKKRLPETVPGAGNEKCIAKAQELVECLGVKGHKVVSVTLKNATLEITFDS